MKIDLTEAAQEWAEENMDCVLDGARGIYIPQAWAQLYNPPAAAATDTDLMESWKLLQDDGPDHDLYWDAWDDVMNAYTLDADGFTLYQNGDLFMLTAEIPEGYSEHLFNW